MRYETPLKYATLCDKTRARADKLRQQANELDAKADEYERRYNELMVAYGFPTDKQART